ETAFHFPGINRACRGKSAVFPSETCSFAGKSPVIPAKTCSFGRKGGTSSFAEVSASSLRLPRGNGTISLSSVFPSETSSFARKGEAYPYGAVFAAQRRKRSGKGVLRRWSGQRDSNSLPPPWQGGALPNELCPRIRRTAKSRCRVKRGIIAPATPQTRIT